MKVRMYIIEYGGEVMEVIEGTSRKAQIIVKEYHEEGINVNMRRATRRDFNKEKDNEN